MSASRAHHTVECRLWSIRRGAHASLPVALLGLAVGITVARAILLRPRHRFPDMQRKYPKVCQSRGLSATPWAPSMDRHAGDSDISQTCHRGTAWTQPQTGFRNVQGRSGVAAVSLDCHRCATGPLLCMSRARARATVVNGRMDTAVSSCIYACSSRPGSILPTSSCSSLLT